MKCKNCGKELKGRFCTECGTENEEYSWDKLRPEESNLSSVVKVCHDEEHIVQERNNDFQRSYNDLSNIFVDKTEKKIATMGGGYIRNFLAADSVAKGYGVLTNKRVYYRGKFYYRNERGISRVNGERIIDLHSVSSVAYEENRNLIAILLMIICVFATLNFFDDYPFIALFFAIVAAIFFFMSNTRFFAIEYEGGKLHIMANSFDKNEMRNFMKSVMKAKEEVCSYKKE